MVAGNIQRTSIWLALFKKKLYLQQEAWDIETIKSGILYMFQKKTTNKQTTNKQSTGLH